jgi:hypothetical protein
MLLQCLHDEDSLLPFIFEVRIGGTAGICELGNGARGVADFCNVSGALRRHGIGII